MKLKPYRGYIGEAELLEDAIRVKLLHISDYISDETLHVEEVEALFKDLVDDYIQTCEEDGREPQKPFSGTFNVRVDKRTHELAAKAATMAEISLNQFVESAIEEKLSIDSARIQHQYIATQISLGSSEDLEQEDISPAETDMSDAIQGRADQVVDFNAYASRIRRTG